MSNTADFTINSSPLGTYYSPTGATIAVLPNGTALVAWVKQVGDFSIDSEIQARWFLPDGTPAGDDFLVNSTLSDFQTRPFATVTSEGKVFLAWESGDGGDGDGVGLRGVVLEPLAQTSMPDFLINPFAVGKGIYNGQNNQFQVSLTALGDGRIFALWTSYDGSDGDSFAIRGRYFSSDGGALGDDFLVNSTSVGGQYEPQASELSDGRILIVYSSTDDADGTPGNIRARIIGTDGDFNGDDFILNSSPGGYQSYVDVTPMSDGGALVVWFSSGVFTPDPEGGNPSFGPGEVRGRIIGADGQTMGPDFQVNSTNLNTHYSKPGATTLEDGRVLVVWHSGDLGDGDWGCVRARLIQADGQLIESDFVINTTPLNNQSSPAAEVLPDGRVLVTWVSDNFDAMGAQARGIYLNPIIGIDGADVLQGTAGQDVVMGLAGDDSVFGESGDDQLMGGTGNDILIGGSGNDLLDGGAGHDTFVTDGDDTITEAAGGGTDTVQSSVTLTLGAHLENLTLTGSAAINGTGNSAKNKIIGNGGDNTLNGGGGNDTMDGGAGHDTYITDGGDRITEAASGGTDTVQSSVTLALGAHLENLTLTGSAAINGTGNSISNVLIGNSVANALSGGHGNDTISGGGGKDLLTGGSGNDSFIFGSVDESSLSATTSDVITDFVQGRDRIDLSAIDAFAGTGTNDVFIWRGTSAFGNDIHGEVRFQIFDLTGRSGDHTMVWIDNDNDTAVEMAIRLTGLHNLTAADFLL